MTQQYYQFAELNRRFNNLLHQGEVTGNHDGLLTVRIDTDSGELPVKGLQLFGRDPDAVHTGETCLVIFPQGAVEQGVVLMQEPDPRLDELKATVDSLTQQLTALRQQITQQQVNHVAG